MPANLTPDFLAAQEKYREAKTIEEKIAALEEMYATLPKHKGTEKLQADIKSRLSKLRNKEKQEGKRSKRYDEFYVPRHGAGQIALVGPPNSGKSSLLARLTAAHPEIAEYPYTTRIPTPGMMEFEDIMIQLVDTPPITLGCGDRSVISLARNADAIALVLDASDADVLDHIDGLINDMGKSRVKLTGSREPADIYEAGTVSRRTLLVANKVDIPDAQVNIDVLVELYGEQFTVQPVSAVTGEGLEDLRRALFDTLGIIRVYAKQPGKPPDLEKPFTLEAGSTLMDFAAAVHKDFVRKLRMAKAWGRDIPDGAQIARDHVLQDGYIVELHA
ncbi:MAG: 50S ribosome-binding GTPase [Armatimonadota bacterium]|nr:50S ribosome-binding GTPase [Armatimonadota bacterium]